MFSPSLRGDVPPSAVADVAAEALAHAAPRGRADAGAPFRTVVAPPSPPSQPGEGPRAAIPTTVGAGGVGVLRRSPAVSDPGVPIPRHAGTRDGSGSAWPSEGPPPGGVVPPAACLGAEAARRSGARTTTTLNLRAEPSTAGEILLVMPAGAEVVATRDVRNGFRRVRYDAWSGWAFDGYLARG